MHFFGGMDLLFTYVAFPEITVSAYPEIDAYAYPENNSI